jgi:predicted nucleotidyltransferase
MKVLGIIAEYNPFHNGHLYHLQAARKRTEADCVVAVMSGNFTQRGEPAIADKWARTEIALLNGIDLVIELPFPYAMGSAEFFAYGAVKLLHSLGAVDSLCFGSESGDLESLSEAASILVDEPDGYKKELKNSLSGGKSFPAARQEALSNYLSGHFGHDALSDQLRSPNNILGIEYLKALKRLNSPIRPVTVGRVGSGYNSADLSGSLSSATAVRRTISENPWPQAMERLREVLPEQTLVLLDREFRLGRGPVFPSDFSSMLLSLFRKMTAEDVRSLPYMEPGLENRFKQAAEIAGSYDELLDRIGTKRYTGTRIQRILFCALAGLTNELFEAFNANGGPAYIRILGFNNTGRQLLSSIKDTALLPVVTKAADFKNSGAPLLSAMLRLEAAAADQYVLARGNAEYRRSGSEFTRNVIYGAISDKYKGFFPLL